MFSNQSRSCTVTPFSVASSTLRNKTTWTRLSQQRIQALTCVLFFFGRVSFLLWYKKRTSSSINNEGVLDTFFISYCLCLFVCFSFPLLLSFISLFFSPLRSFAILWRVFYVRSVCPSVRVHRIWERQNGFSLNLISENFNTLSSHYNFHLD